MKRHVLRRCLALNRANKNTPEKTQNKKDIRFFDQLVCSLLIAHNELKILKNIKGFTPCHQKPGPIAKKREFQEEKGLFVSKRRTQKIFSRIFALPIPLLGEEEYTSRGILKIKVSIKMKKSLFLYSFVAFLLGGVSAFADRPKPWQLGFQDPVTPVMEQIISLHTLLMGVITVIALIVFSLLGYAVYRFSAKRNPSPSKTSHHTFLEVIWTTIPVLILLGISFPSFKLLYFMDKAEDAELTVNIVGRQWYWHYAYPEEDFEFDSVMIPEDEVEDPSLRLLAVDNPLVIPVDTTVRFLLTADDVLHAFAVPAFGIKQDTVPGRISEVWARVTKEGTYYGQCSELCGAEHAYMPIAVKVVSKEAYQEWLLKSKQAFAMNTQESLADKKILLAQR